MKDYSNIEYTLEQIEHIARMLKAEKEILLACVPRGEIELDPVKSKKAFSVYNAITPKKIQEEVKRLDSLARFEEDLEMLDLKK